jgi:hypothetical protein
MGAADQPIAVHPEEVTVRGDLEVGCRILSDDSSSNG